MRELGGVAAAQVRPANRGWPPKYMMGRFPTAPPREAILTREQAARWLQMSVRSLDRSSIPRVKVGTRVRYSVEAVLEWIRRGAEIGAL
jgi:hypothetical protein